MESYVDLQIVTESPDGATVFINDEPAVNQAQHSPVSTTDEDQRTEGPEWDEGQSCITTERPSLEANNYREAIPNSKPEGPAPLFPISLSDAHLSSQDLEKGQASTIASTAIDPNIVDWDGPDDSANPYNWTTQRKWATVILITAQTFLSPLASSMFAPGVPQVLHDFNSHDTVLGSFVVSVYVLGYAFGPLFIAPLSELYGRNPIFNATNFVFVVSTVACALSSNFNMLIGFRFLEGVAGSAAITLGGGTIADIFVQRERGTALSVWSMGPLLGPIIGPTAGGFLAQAKGWRWIFWVISIASGAVSVGFVFFLRETYSITILQHKTKRLRKLTGNEALRSKMDRGLSPGALFKLSIVRPTKMLCCSPIVFSLSLLIAIIYGYMYVLFTTMTAVFEQMYGFSQGTVGLTYLGMGLGELVGLIIFLKVSDWLLKQKGSVSGECKPEYRLPPMIPGSIFIPVGLFIYGWTVEKHTFWFLPILGTSLFGLGLISVFLCVTAYLVDAFTLYAVSAIAAYTVLRSLFGGLLPLAGPPMYQTLGQGWGNSLLGFIAMALTSVPVLLYKYGEKLRTHPKYQLNL